LESVEIDEQHGDLQARLTTQSRDGVTDAVKEQTAVGETRERVVERTLAHLVIEAAVLDRHRRLERERLGQRESTFVYRAILGGGELRNADRVGMGDKRKQQHGRTTEAAKMCPFRRI